MHPTASLQAFKDSSSSQTDRQDLPQQAAGQALAVARNSPSYSNMKCRERNRTGMSQAIEEDHMDHVEWYDCTTRRTVRMQQSDTGCGNFMPAYTAL